MTADLMLLFVFAVVRREVKAAEITENKIKKQHYYIPIAPTIDIPCCSQNQASPNDESFVS